MKKRQLLHTLLALVAAGLTLGAQAQDFPPKKTITMVVGFAAGGAADTGARIIARKLGENIGASIVVDNNPGAGGNIGADFVAKSPADGYTLVMGTVGTHSINGSLYEKMPYDMVKNFAPVSLIASAPNLLVNAEKVPARTLPEFIAYLKANPGKVAYGSSGIGSSLHLGMELLLQRTGTQAIHVPYKGSAPTVKDLISGQTHLLVDVASVIGPHIQSGKLKAIYVTDAQRQAALPSVATARESGYPALETTGWQGIVGPAGLPREIVTRVARAVRDTLARPEVRQRFAQTGSGVIERGPEDFSAFVAAEIARWTPVIKASGATLD